MNSNYSERNHENVGNILRMWTRNCLILEIFEKNLEWKYPPRNGKLILIEFIIYT